LVGNQLEEMWHLLEEKEFTVVEFGAGTGAFYRDILHQLKPNRELYEQLKFCIVGKSAVMREQEKMILPEKVVWFDSIQEIPKITGCILSNEVVDNFSVHQVVMEEELKEVFVDYNQGFVEVLKPASEELKDYLAKLDVTLPKEGSGPKLICKP
jgi:SAM-dependent MidA family methyltransferase